MKTTGVSRQERKIESMADIVTGLCPEMPRISVKGAFRLGINEALINSGYSNWKDLAEKPLQTKQKFFNDLLNSSLPHLLKIGLPRHLEQRVRTGLSKENERFLRS